MHAILPSPVPTSPTFYTEKRASVREALLRDRTSKGEIRICVKDRGNFLGAGEKRDFWIACFDGPQVVFYLESHFLSISPPRAIQTDGPCPVTRRSSSSGLFLNTVPQYLSCSKEFQHKYREQSLQYKDHRVVLTPCYILHPVLGAVENTKRSSKSLASTDLLPSHQPRLS